jgi:hypothetical protein
MEHGLWEPGESFSVSAQPTSTTDEKLDISDLIPLHTQFYIDKAALARRIEALLEHNSQVTLAEVLACYPPEKGLAEVLAYCTLAADDPDHRIDAQRTETIELATAAADGGQGTRVVTIPHVLYKRRNYDD